MIQNATSFVVETGARSMRERRRKRTYSDYVSDDSAVEVDLESGSDSEPIRGSSVGPTKAKQFKSGCDRSGAADSNIGCPHGVGDAESIARGDEEKLLMRQWLQRQADEGTIPGLRWIDEKNTQVRIPWKHGSRTGWTIDDCRVYKAWATHTGKIACIKEPKKWKANFRCALNSLPDVRELPLLCQKKGSDPFKVYLMLPEVPRKSLAKKTKRCKTERIDDEIDDFHENKFAVSTIKIKEEDAPVSKCNENPSYGHYFWMNANTNCIKKEEPDTETQFVQSLIPTVVEEFSEQGRNEPTPVLTDLHSVCLSTSEMTMRSNTPSPSSSSSSSYASSSSPSSSSASIDSSFFSISCGEIYIDDFTDYNLFADVLPPIGQLFDSKFDWTPSDLDGILGEGIKAEFFMTSYA